MSNVDHGPRIGADPELFIRQMKDNKIIPVCGHVGGTKENPLIIDNLIEAVYGAEREDGRFRRPALRGILLPENGEINEAPAAPSRRGNYAIQEDNVMLEFNIPAYKNYSPFCDAVGKALNIIDTNILGPKDYRSTCQVMHTFSADEIASNPQSMQIGCLSDMDAYAPEGQQERAPFNAAHFGNHRFCGGHIHVQYNTKRMPEHVFVQFMDLYVALPSLRHDKQKMRRMFYGQPGLYRKKPYGIEYRTLSNFWLDSKFRESGNLAILAQQALSLGQTANTNTGLLNDAYTKIDWGDVQHAIKTENHKLAEEIVVFARDHIGLPISTCYR